jgi:hypothetical protein
MRIAVRHWAVAGLVALSAHLGVAATVLVSAPPRGAKAIGADGIEIALGAAGGAPGAVAPVPPAAEPRDVSDAQFVPVQSPETEIARQAIEEVAVEQVSAAEEPVLSVPESVTTPVVAEAVPVQETPVLADAVPPVSRTVRPAETVAINVPVEPKPKRKPAPPVAVKQVAPPREVPAEFRVAEAVPVSQEPVVAGDILQPASGPPA